MKREHPSHIDLSQPCEEWTRYPNLKGYGRIRDKAGRYSMAHRVAYEQAIGPIPAGLVIDHLCRNPACINPAHLEPVTNRENLRRGVGSPRRTHCKRGHEFTEENVLHLKNGKRCCRICNRQWHRHDYWRRKAAAQQATRLAAAQARALLDEVGRG